MTRQAPGIFPAGQHSQPQNPQGRKGSLRSAPPGKPLRPRRTRDSPTGCPTEKMPPARPHPGGPIKLANSRAT